MSQPSACDHGFHVDRNAAQGGWDVVDEDGKLLAHRHDQTEAIGFAIREAQHSHAAGKTSMVCVQQPDGAYTLAWTSH